MSVDMARVDGVPGVWGSACSWGAACEMGAVRSQPRCFRVMLYAEAASVRRGDLCVHSQANSYFICLCTRRRADGARVADRYGEVWKAHWHGSVALEAFKRSRPARNA